MKVQKKNTEEILDKIVEILDNDYDFGNLCTEVYIELRDKNTITEKNLYRAMNTAIASIGLDRDTLEDCYEENKQIANEIANRLDL